MKFDSFHGHRLRPLGISSARLSWTNRYQTSTRKNHPHPSTLLLLLAVPLGNQHSISLLPNPPANCAAHKDLASFSQFSGLETGMRRESPAENILFRSIWWCREEERPFHVRACCVGSILWSSFFSDRCWFGSTPRCTSFSLSKFLCHICSLFRRILGFWIPRILGFSIRSWAGGIQGAGIRAMRVVWISSQLSFGVDHDRR